MKKGLFITFEGLDGSGKSTQINLLKRYLSGKGHDIVFSREPGGCPVSEKIRAIILGNENPMSAITEALLYAAARAEHVDRVVRPAIESGKTIILDRYVDSSLAYQGCGRELGIQKVREINDYAIRGIIPDITVYIDLPVDIALKRIAAPLDRLESAGEAFFLRVLEGYNQLTQLNPERIIRIDGMRSAEAVFDDIKRRVDALLDKAGGANK